MLKPYRINPRLLAEFRNTGRRLQAERQSAPSLVDRLLSKTPRSEWGSKLSQHPDLMTCGALERLGKLFAHEFGRDPKLALNIAELEVSAAESLPETAYPSLVMAQIRAHGWKDLGKAYRNLNRHTDSLDALHRADSYLEPLQALVHDRAIVRFNLAVTLQEVERYEESLQILNECRDVFRGHGDTPLLVFCGIAEGVLFQRLRKHREAREIYLVLLASTKNIDHESLAALHQAIGFCSIELGDFETARANLQTALELNRSLGKPVEIMKIQLGWGRLLARSGQYQQAIDHLRPVRRQFLSNGMPEEAGLCGLEAVEAMLALGKASQAENLAHRIVVEFTKAGLNTRAITAVGYLTEAIANRNASPGLVTQVREYIVSLRTAPERDFVIA